MVASPDRARAYQTRSRSLSSECVLPPADHQENSLNWTATLKLGERKGSRRVTNVGIGPWSGPQKVKETLVHRIRLRRVRREQSRNRLDTLIRQRGQKAQYIHRKTGSLSAVPQVPAELFQKERKTFGDTVGNGKLHSALRSRLPRPRKFLPLASVIRQKIELRGWMTLPC